MIGTNDDGDETPLGCHNSTGGDDDVNDLPPRDPYPPRRRPTPPEDDDRNGCDIDHGGDRRRRESPRAEEASSPRRPPPPSNDAVPAEDGGDDVDDSIQSSSSSPAAAAASQQRESWLKIGRMVHVQPRTWPGMNRPGGLGRVVKLYFPPPSAAADDGKEGAALPGARRASSREGGGGTTTTTIMTTKAIATMDEATHVDVKYLASEMTRQDRGVPVRYVSDREYLAIQITNGDVGARCASTRRSRRDAVNSRRCGKCGSFAIDCGDCDYVAIALEEEELRRRRRWEMEEEMERRCRRRTERTMGVSDDGRVTLTSGDSDDDDDDEYDSHDGGNSSEEEEEEDDGRGGGMDSEEEERRRVTSMNRHRRRNGQITRRRRGGRRSSLMRQNETSANGATVGKSNGDGDGGHDEVDTSDDELPLAILQLQKERRRRLLAVRGRERKLRDMNLMLNKLDYQLMKKDGTTSGGSKKRKKRSSRTRPKNACALIGSLPGAAIAAIDDDTNANDAARRDNSMSASPIEGGGMAQDDHSRRCRSRRDPTDRIDGMNGKRNNDLSDFNSSSSTDDDMDTFSDLRARGTHSSTFVAHVDVDVNANDVYSTNRSIDSETDVATINDERGISFLTPFEESESGESDDDYLHTPRDESSVENEESAALESGDDEEAGKLKVSDMEWGMLPKFIEELCADIRDMRITHVHNKLNELKRRLQAAKKMSSSRTPYALTTLTATMSEEAMDELDKLSKESDELNCYIVKMLHRRGVDLCNKALMRLLSKRERRENECKLTDSQKRLCRMSAVDVWDVRVVELCDLVRDADSKVTSFQKEVEKELQSGDDDHCHQMLSDNGGDIIPVNDFFDESSRIQQPKKKRRTVERDWDDNHPHASRKRKSSSGLSSRKDLKQRRQLYRSRRTTSRCDANFDKSSRLSRSSRDAPLTENEDKLSPPATADEEEANSTTNVDFVDIDFVGDTDDIEDDHWKCMLLDSSSAMRLRSSANKRISQCGAVLASIKGTGSCPQQQSRSISLTMSGWLEKQQDGSEKEKKNFHGSRLRENSQSTRQKTGAQTANSRRTHQLFASKGRVDQNQRQDGSKGSLNIDPESPPTRPEIPHALSADLLFASIPTNLTNRTVVQQELGSDNNRSIIDLCRDLRDCYPANLPLSRNILANLATVVLSKYGDVLKKEEVVAMFQTLLYIFEEKCTTLLDLIQTNPEVASFHISCWSLVFQTLGKKCSAKLALEDGLLFKIFGNHTTLAKLLLLQVVDVLYSQLLWEEYGHTSSFNSRVFDELRSLCVCIGSIVPVLSNVCSILTMLDEPRWQLSLNHERKENEPETLLFVTTVDPEMHKRFITSGELPESTRGADESKIRSFDHKIPREKIDAIWSIIGFFSCCTSSMAQSAPDFKQPQMLLARLIFCDCGSLPNSNQQLPPPPLQVKTCSKEIKWVDALLSSRLLGDLPSMDSFVKQIIEKSVMLEAYDAVLSLLPSSPQAKVNRSVRQLWDYSCINGSSKGIGSELQTDLMDVNSIFLANETNSVYRLSPSSVLLQKCVTMATSYASMTMIKSIRWKSFRTLLQSIASRFVDKALDIEVHSNAARIRSNDDYTAMFQSIIESATSQIEISQTSSHLREAACYLIFSGIVARSRYNSPGEGNNFHLNKVLRENIWKYSSDEKMRKHQQHFLNEIGVAPASSSNICLLYTSSKSMAFTALLHLYISDFTADPHQIIERLRSHLVAVKAEIDADAMVYLLTSIISNLLSTCDLLESLNEKGRLSENEEKCKAHMNASKSCVDIIGSITMHINLILGRAKFILEFMTKVTPNDNILLQLVVAIKTLGSSKFFRCLMDSLTKALVVIVQTVTMNTLAKALSKDGCVEASFRSCLGAIRQVIALVLACGTDELPDMQRAQSNTDWHAGADFFLSFVTTQLLTSVGNKNEPDEHRRLCQSQSGGILSVLAALCAIIPLSGAYELFEPKHATAAENRFYLQRMATCFSCELLRLSRHSRLCKALAMQHIQQILNYMFVALVDSDTLAMFPTSNLSLLFVLDGHNSRSKGNDLLSKAQVHLSSTLQDPDIEAYKIKKMSGEYFDSAGPTYFSKNIWSFIENVGHLLASSTPYDIKYTTGSWQSFRFIGTIIVNVVKKLHSDKDLLELLPQVSVERECLKRFLVFRALFKSLKKDLSEPILGGICTVILTSIIENLYYISGIEQELEEQISIGCDDPDTRYRRAKALAFHRAYTELCGSTMTIMLRDNNKWDIIARDFIRVLIASAFRRDLDLRRYIEESAKKLNLRLRRRSFKGRVLHLTEYLALSFYHRTDDLLVYVAGCGDYRALLFNAMFSGLSTREIDKIDAFVTIVGSRLTLTSTTIRAQINLALDGLERAIENVMFWAEDDGIDDLDSMIQLRDWVMNVFLVGRLGNHGTAPRVISLSLKLLTRMMKIFLPDKFAPNQNICTASENLTSTAYVKLVHSLKECLCNSLRSYYYETIVAEFFHCARHLLALPCTLGVAEGTVTILSWACAPPTNSTDNISSEHSTYTYEVIIWLKVCGELLRHQATTKVLRDLLLQVNLNGDANTSSLDVAGPNYVSLKRFCSSLDTLNKLERDLTLQTAKNVLISNPYVGKSIGNTDIMSQHTLSGESLRAIDEYCRYLNSRGCDS